MQIQEEKIVEPDALLDRISEDDLRCFCTHLCAAFGMHYMEIAAYTSWLLDIKSLPLKKSRFVDPTVAPVLSKANFPEFLRPVLRR